MKKDFSSAWNKSVKPRKQRKYRFNAPLHIKGKFLSSHLSKELKQEYKKRNIRVIKGDKIKVSRGTFKGKIGEVEQVDIKNEQIFVSKIEYTKKDGSKARYPLHPSNIIIIGLNLKDKIRKEKLEQNKKK